MPFMILSPFRTPDHLKPFFSSKNNNVLFTTGTDHMLVSLGPIPAPSEVEDCCPMRVRPWVSFCLLLIIFCGLAVLTVGSTSILAQTTSCPCTIWPSTAIPGTLDTNETQSVELGVKFTSTASGFIRGIRFYKGVNNTGTHVGNLWSSTGTLLASATFTNETASGWQQANFSTPVAITANTVYIVSYFSPTGDFSVDRNYFATAGVNNPPLQAPVDGGAGGANAVYAYASKSQFPTTSYSSSNYWVDVVFGGGAVVTPVTITTSTLAGGIQGTAYSQTLTASGGTSPYAWTLVSGTNLPAGLTLSSSGVISGTPSGSGTTNFTVKVTDSSNPAQTAQATLSITVTAGNPPPNCPCSIWPKTATPVTPDSFNSQPVELGVKFTSSSNGYITGI